MSKLDDAAVASKQPSINLTMARDYTFRLLNVFAEETFGGNALCVFEDASGLSDDEMLALARQFNLSETTFILPSDKAAACVRIFTTGYEMPFAGHPTLGTAHVVRDLHGTGDALALEFAAGVVPVSAEGDVWKFRAPPPPANAERVYPATASRELIANMVGLSADELASDPMWVNMGTDQLLIPLKDADAVRLAQPVSSLLQQWPQSTLGRKTGYVFAFENTGTVLARYFFTMQGGGVSEDPGTGSACANLGAWMLHTGHAAPFSVDVRQGEAVHRPCHLKLSADAEGNVYVGGAVREIGRGTVSI